jgi:cytoskeleton-associated protein 5
VRAVNVLMLRMLEACDRNACFAALLQLLRAPPPGLDAPAAAKFADLSVKCLIKMTKGLQATRAGLDLPRLLLDLHDFFSHLGVDEIRRRSAAEDKPLRMAKTILHELCLAEGLRVYDHAARVPGRGAPEQPMLYVYIGVNLRSLGLIPAAGGAPPSAAPAPAAAAAPPRESDAERAAAVAATAAQAELKARLKEVLTQLAAREPVARDAAMAELHRLRAAHPAYVARAVAQTTGAFRAHIDAGLAALDAAGGPGAPPTPALAPAAGSPGRRPSPTRGAARPPAANVELRSSIEELTARMAALRERTSGTR